MNEKILIVDDEKDIRKFLDILLSNEGFRVRRASKGAEAMDIFKSEPFELVITDIRMPEMDGLELMKHLKASDENIEVIVLTGFATLDNAVRALRDGGASDYLLKPLENIEDLFIAVNRALEKRRSHIESKADIEKKKRDFIQISDKLSNRIKRLTCLLEIYDIYQKNGLSLEEMIQEIVITIPRSFRYPEICCARVVLDKQIFGTDKFRETQWKLTGNICVNGDQLGVLDICYSEGMSKNCDSIFSEEECRFVSSVCMRLEKIIEKKQKALSKPVNTGNRTENDLLASLNNEFRDPLNSIVEFAETLHYQRLGALNEKQSECVQDILQSGKHLLTLINDVR
ncbi:response regulator [Desulfobacterales bacterium HSG2]|nr:response regulator [Desulfobacterales bacterium HSG2]